jgi:hypothetical protein
LDHGSLSIRAGIRLRMAELLAVSGVAVIAPSLSAAVWGGYARHRITRGRHKYPGPDERN